MTAANQTRRRGGQRRVVRFLAYGAVGWIGEVALLAARDLRAGRPVRSRIGDRLVMVPVYGLGVPFFEPLHDALRSRLPTPARALVYGVGFWAVEYAVGRSWRALTGDAPWDYSADRFNINGLIRLDYLPLWAGAGLFGERLHDALTVRP